MSLFISNHQLLFFSISSTSLTNQNLHKSLPQRSIHPREHRPAHSQATSPPGVYSVLTFALVRSFARSQPNLCVCATPGIRCKVPYLYFGGSRSSQVQVPPSLSPSISTALLQPLQLCVCPSCTSLPLPVPGLADNRGTATVVAYLALPCLTPNIGLDRNKVAQPAAVSRRVVSSSLVSYF